MGFFDDLKVIGADLLAKGSVVAKDAAQKAQDATEMGKIKVEILSKEKEIKDLYTKIGKAYYEEYKEDAAEFAEDIEAINAKFAAISDLKSKYEMFKDALNKKTENAATATEYADDIEDAIIVVPAEKNAEDILDAAEEKAEDILDTVEDVVEDIVDTVEEKLDL